MDQGRKLEQRFREMDFITPVASFFPRPLPVYEGERIRVPQKDSTMRQGKKKKTKTTTTFSRFFCSFPHLIKHIHT
jgi:hypothetical protein